ncbi:hypothetical protein DEALK_02650 [Dehalogenimonas alkenigignens]|uniref:Uncharacterized protein n=1 Tax=Dehalogenimonas alkenigignens TaxID=1217799 RepID=A0A0W0GLD0_9CHLR|nr:hypothetical protein [Dehalogenimonas alkenigignens]KTB49352.1 hypothetical protein DEALK_02650 [Dehalogenimonas alkenigignens]
MNMNRYNHEDFELLFSRMGEGVALHELIYDETGTATDYRIIDVNPGYESLANIGNERAIGALASTIGAINMAKNLMVTLMVLASSIHPSSVSMFSLRWQITDRS